MRLERIAHWAEIVGNFGVIVTLVILIFQVRDNTQALMSQAILQRGAPLTEPYVWGTQLPSILAKVKEVDGADPIPQAFMDRYDLTYEESVIWERHMNSIWTSMAAEYALLGESETLALRVRTLLSNADQLLWFETGGARMLGAQPEFLSYVEAVR